MTQSVGETIGAAVHQNKALSVEGLLERAFARMFRGLVYAQIWEDPVCDMVALDIGPRDHVVTIASGGCNLMSYLTANPASITAVDLSPAHVHLARLKLLAARELSQPEFYDLFGYAKCGSNVDVYNARLAPCLSADARTFWNETTLSGPRKDMFRKGLYRYGALGRFLGLVHLVARVAGVDFQTLLRCQTLAEQEAFFESEIAPLYDTRLVRFLARRRASLFGLGIPPAQYDKLAADAGGDVIPVLRERTRKLFCDFPISENYFAWQAATRAYEPSGSGPVPPYLVPSNFDAVKSNSGRAQVLNRSMTDMLADEASASKHVYVLLDAQDWMSDTQLDALWDQITRTAAPGARVLFRTGGAADILPGRVSPKTLERWCYDVAASETAFLTDRSAIYGGVHLYRFQG